MRVYAGGILHESHSFSRQATTLADFHGLDRPAIEDDQSLAGTRSTEGGLLAAAGQFGWTLHCPFIAVACPSGPLTRDTFETITRRLIDGLVAVRPSGRRAACVARFDVCGRRARHRGRDHRSRACRRRANDPDRDYARSAMPT